MKLKQLPVVLALALSLAGSQSFISVPAAQAASKQDTVKGALLANIIKFVKWPGNPSIKVCGVGNSAIGSVIKGKVGGIKVAGKPVSYKSVPNAGAAAGCQVAIFDGGSVPGSLKSKPILTVGNGGIISFSSSGGKIRFSVNKSMASKNKLSISAQLLKLAKSVS